MLSLLPAASLGLAAQAANLSAALCTTLIFAQPVAPTAFGDFGLAVAILAPPA
ncbi:hypothetical protein N9W17_02430 [Jannaschia sp.]|nr:hypothetical protein [Jannaschia sp.]